MGEIADVEDIRSIKQLVLLLAKVISKSNRTNVCNKNTHAKYYVKATFRMCILLTQITEEQERKTPFV